MNIDPQNTQSQAQPQTKPQTHPDASLAAPVARQENQLRLALLSPEVKGDRSDLDQVLSLLEKAAKENAQMAILPELWNTPFVNDDILAHSEDWKTYVPALEKAARKHGMWIVAGTLPIPDEQTNKLRNRCLIINDKGEQAAFADKLHLLEVHTKHHDYLESDVFEEGECLCKVPTPWGNLGVLVCYDIRFPEAARLLCQDCSLLAVCAGFNESVGKKHWQPLLQTRAMENQVFVAGVNPARHDYGSYRSYGHSLLCSPDGEVITECDPQQSLSVVQIDLRQADAVRFRQPFWKKRRSDLYTLQPASRHMAEEAEIK